jgi:hypothetical protein
MLGERKIREVAKRLGFRLVRKKYLSGSYRRDGSLYGIDLTTGATFFRVVEEGIGRTVTRIKLDASETTRICLFAQECGFENRPYERE